jgi:Fibronectin type III domain
VSTCRDLTTARLLNVGSSLNCAVMLPAPTNVQLRRTSSTSLEVKWDPPGPAHPSTAAGYHMPSVTGYRVYYSPFVDHDLDRWSSVEIGPYTTHDLQGLDPHTVYAVQVRAKWADGRYGNLSEVVVSNRIEHGKIPLWKIDLFRIDDKVV